MGVAIVPHAPERAGHVAELNRRLSAAGSTWRFYESHIPDWLPRRPGQKVWREYHLAVEDGGTVRGGYCLKPQEFLVHGESCVVGSWQGPVSEGIADRRYNALGLVMIQDMLRKQPALFSWGATEPLPRILRSLCWLVVGTPFCLRVLRPFRFLRRNAFLRRTGTSRALLDLLAFSGAGLAGHAALRAVERLRAPRIPRTQAEVVESFGAWADEVWERSAARYTMIAVRDSATMNALLPQDGWPNAIRLRVSDGSRDIGWAAVVDSPMQSDRRFGSLRVGTVIDCLAEPEDAPGVVSAALDFLAARGADIVCSNVTHPEWVRAFAANGFHVLEDRRLFSASRELAGRLGPFEEARRGIHLTPLDGDGPQGFALHAHTRREPAHPSSSS